jgi:hypothetical protein
MMMRTVWPCSSGLMAVEQGGRSVCMDFCFSAWHVQKKHVSARACEDGLSCEFFTSHDGMALP